MLVRCLILAVALLIPSHVLAEGAGQADLDKALEMKLSAESIRDLGEVINLCRSALAGGLDEGNKEFAEKLLVGTLMQRAEILCQQIFDQPEPIPQWPLMRRQALLDLEEAAKIDKEQFQVQFLIGRLNALPGGDRKQALAALGEAIKLATEAPEDQAKALILRANLTEDATARLADYDQAVELVPEDAEIVRSRGMYLLMEKKYDGALADMDKAIELEPDNADTYEARGVVLFLQGKNEEALKSFDRAIELQPGSAVAYTHRARIHAIDGELDKALEQLNEAIKLDSKLAQAYLLRARIYQQQQKMDEALADVDTALRLAPGDSQTLQLRALLLAGSGNLDDAIEDLQKLYKAEPQNEDLQMQLGLFYSADKQPRKAVELFTALLEKNAENLAALRNRGDAWLGMGDLAKAIADYEAALKLDDKDSAVLNNLAWLLATAPDDKLRNGQRSLELAKQAARVTEFKQAHILSTLAAAYAETGDFENAIVWSRKAVQMADKSADNREITDQLHKELASYEAKQPWREEIPAHAESSDPEPEELPQPDESGAKEL